MSILRFMFDNDWQQRRDIEELRDQQYKMALSNIGSSGGASERWVGEIAAEVRELAATVQVLMQMLAEKGGLDVAEVERRVDEELKPKSPQPRSAKPKKPAKPAGLVTDETCGKCGIGDRSSEMVRVGSTWFCRPCARNP